MTEALREDNLETSSQSRLARAMGRVARIEKSLAGARASAPTGELAALWNARVRPFWGLFPGIYEKLSAILVKRGENFFAAEVAEEGAARFPDNPLLPYRQALALARAGGRDRALTIVENRWEALAGLSDARPLLGRLFKDAAKATGDASLLRRARDEYGAAAMEPRDDVYFPAVNAATLSALVGDGDEAARFAKMVEVDLERRGGASNYWERASLAEARLATGNLAGAREMYREAMAGDPARDQVLTTREQAMLLLAGLGLDRGELDDVFGRPLVVCITGHRVDRADREEPRFPTERVESVRARMAATIGELAPWVGFAAGADGGDLIGLELLREAGVDCSVVLPLEREKFARASVTDGWAARYETALDSAVAVWESQQDEGNQSLWAFGNAVILGSAMRRAREWNCELIVLAVWDGREGDGAGGTADMVARARSAGLEVRAWNPLDDAPVSAVPTSTLAESDPPVVVCVHASNAGALPDGVDWLDRARDVVELEPEVRATFGKPQDAIACARAMREAWPTAGIGLSAGPSGSGGRSAFTRQAAGLARSAGGVDGALAGWEFVALTATLKSVAVESAGRRTLPDGSRSPVFTVSW